MHPTFDSIQQLMLQQDHTHLRELDALLIRAQGFISELTEQDLLGLLLVVLDDRFDAELRSHTMEALETFPEHLLVPAALSVPEHAVSDEENLDLLFNRLVFHPPFQQVLLEQLQHRKHLVPLTICRVTRVEGESRGKRRTVATELLQKLWALST